MPKVTGWKKSKIKGNSRVSTIRCNGKTYQIKCEAEKKWDIEAEHEAKEKGKAVGDCWREIQSEEEKDIAFSQVKADTCFGRKKDDKDYEYVILMNGKRTGRYSKTGSGTGWGIKNFIPLLENMDAKVKASIILVDNDAPLERQAELLAKHVEKLKGDEHCKKVHVLGHSKCGTMNVAMLKYLSDDNLDKLNVMSYSAPYKGTIFATPKAFEERLEEVVKEGREPLLKRVIKGIRKVEPRTNGIVAEGILKTLKAIYCRIFSDGHMDLDISEGKEGIYPKQQERYDERYLSQMFGEETLAKLRKIKFTNITTFCTKRTLGKAIEEQNVMGGLMYLASITIFKKGEKSDGTVGLESALHIERICEQNGIEIGVMRIDSGHHGLFTDSSILKQIFDELIDKKIQEQRRKEEIER